MSLPKLNPVEPPWYGPVCPVVGEGWHREVSPYPDHETVGLLLLGLIALHASAALYHHFWRRDDTLDAMLPHGMRRRASPGRAQKAEVLGSANPRCNNRRQIHRLMISPSPRLPPPRH